MLNPNAPPFCEIAGDAAQKAEFLLQVWKRPEMLGLEEVG